ncbi:uncharacterized protein LOC103502886 [Cucumis melo]|uniref:Uncharacterized protein LOC103502886 n=1 Tax=Cucumis melo TaxID=3656 RepID=A0A1S3CNE2_CUCME|nr:uncharacterized protein LOC103502886 [Cucumis melo]
MNCGKQSGGSQSASWSYECTICKRSFKSAKALGGHMHIHSNEEIDTKLKLQSTSESIPTDLRWVVPSATAEGRGRDRNRGKGSKEQVRMGKVKELSLFGKKPSNLKKLFGEKTGQSSQQDNVVSEVDLELRLGSNPKKSTLTTFKFF